MNESNLYNIKISPVPFEITDKQIIDHLCLIVGHEIKDIEIKTLEESKLIENSN